MSELTRVTANFTPSALRALDRLCEGGISKTDALNRAVAIAAVVHDLADDGRLLVISPSGEHQTLIFL